MLLSAGFAAGGSTVRNQYLQKRRQLFKVGSRGSEPGCFTWPRGIAVGSDNAIVVADSSNHRVQVSIVQSQRIVSNKASKVVESSRQVSESLSAVRERF